MKFIESIHFWIRHWSDLGIQCTVDTTTCLEARGTGSGFARSPTWWLISCAHLSQRRKRSRTLWDSTWQRGGLTPPSPPDWWGWGQWCSCPWMRVFLPKNIVSVYLRETHNKYMYSPV